MDPAGNSTAGTSPTSPGAAPNATLPPDLVVATRVAYAGCILEPANLMLTEGEARALLPEGFDPLPFQGIPGTGTGVLFALRCGSAATEIVNETDALEFGAYLGVDPPDELEVEGIAGYRFMLAHVIASDAIAASYAALGHAVATGDVSASFARTGVATVSEASAQSDALSASFTARVVDFPQGFDAITLRFFEARDGVVAGGVDFALEPGLIAGGEGAWEGSAPFGGEDSGPALGFHYEWAEGAPSLTVTPFSVGA